MKKVTTLILLLMIFVAGCSVNNNADDQNSDDLKPLTFNNNADQTNSTNQNNQMTDQNLGVQAEQNQPVSSASQSETGELALIKTNLGDIKIKLYSESAPITVTNFKKYINEKFYDGTIFHRVIDSFMVQGGGFDTAGNQKATSDPIKNEAKNGLSNKRGTLAMARTMVTDSATSQFFINLVDNNFLDYKDDANYGYAVFGEVVDGMDVVDKIAKVETGNHGVNQDWPVENVVINSIEMVK